MSTGRMIVAFTLFLGGCNSGREATQSVAPQLSGGGDEVDCSQRPPVFPGFDRSCQAASDCDLVLHQTDCCGTQHALGIHPRDRARFDADEAICSEFGPRGYPPCGCAGQGIFPDIGDPQYDADHIAVDCIGGSCTTLVVP